MKRRSLLRGAFLLSLGACAALAPPIGASGRAGLVRFEHAPLAIASASGLHRFTVELALSADQQKQGLMFRRRLAPDAGMLFVYRFPQIISMWMRNTYIPLDMLFVGAGGRIVRIVERTRPLSAEIVSSGKNAIAVLELNAGTAARLGIARGDRVIAAALGTSGE